MAATPGAGPAAANEDAAEQARAAAAFLAAWTEQDPDARTAALDDSASPQLARAMKNTRADLIWDQGVDGKPVTRMTTPTRAEFRQLFRDGRAVIVVVERADTRDGWWATTIALDEEPG